MKHRNALSVVVITNCMLASIVSTGELATNSLDSDAIQVFEDMCQRSDHSLWPGYDPNKYPVAIFDGEHTYLFRHPSPTEEFKSVKGIEDVKIMNGRHDAVNANSSSDLGGIITATLMLSEKKDEPIQNVSSVLIHELFHVYQREYHSDWVPNEVVNFTYPKDNIKALAIRHMETEALKRSINETEDSKSVAWAKKAKQLRKTRFELIAEDCIEYEQMLELREGLAQYVEYIARGTNELPVFPENGYGPNELRRRVYNVGHSWALLLDRFSEDWKQRVNNETGITLDGLLEEKLADIAWPPAELSRDEEESFYKQASTEVSEFLKERDKLRTRFFAKQGWRVVVQTNENPLWPNGFDPMNVMVLTDKEVLHTRFLSLKNESGGIECYQHELLTEASGAHPLFNGIKRAAIYGIESKPAVETTGKQVSVTADGIDIQFSDAKVSIKDQEILIQLN